MKNVLVLGAAGYVGDILTDKLLAEGYNVTGYDSLLYETRYLKKIPFVYGDVRDYDKLSQLLPLYDVVVHLAAIVGDGAVAAEPFLSRDINVNSVAWLVSHFDGKIITMSSCSVYGINNNLIDETEKPNPVSEYGRQKVQLENVLLSSSRQTTKDCLVFRLGTLYGASGQFARVRFDLVANVLAMKAAIGEPIVLTGRSQWRPLLHVEDVAMAILHGIKNDIRGLYNLHQTNMTIGDFSVPILALDPQARIEYRDIAFEDQRNYRVISDAYRETGWKPTKTLIEGMTEIYRLVKEGRIKNVKDPIYYNVDHMNRVKTADWK